MKNKANALDIYSVHGAFDALQLRLIRELRGLKKKEVAELISVTPPAITQFESGAHTPSPQVIARLSLALQVPVSFFMGRSLFGLNAYGKELKGPYQLSIENTHFRSMRSTKQAERRKVLAKGSVVLSVLSALEEIYGLIFPKEELGGLKEYGSTVKDNEDIEELALRVRQSWLAEPLGQKYLYSPLGYQLIPLLESKGICVMMLKDHSKRLDAFSNDEHRACVFLSTEKQPGSRTPFSIAHELGHLLMHQDVEIEPENAELEKQANRFASALLMPREIFSKTLPRRMDALGWQKLFRAKEKWGVSIAAQIKRATDLNVISEATSRRAWSYINRNGWRVEEPEEKPFRQKLQLPKMLEQAMNMLSEEEQLEPKDFSHLVSLRADDLQNILHFKMPKAQIKREVPKSISPIIHFPKRS